jgi:LEA14-like dessication related protein
MKVWEIIGLAGIAWFGWDLWQKYEAGSNLAVNLQNVDLSNFPNVVVTLSVQNVTNTPLTIQSLAGNVAVQGTPLGSISSTTPVTLQPNQVTTVPINFSASLINLPGAIVNVISQLGGSLAFNVVGSANVQGIPVPVPINVTQNFQS